MKDDYLNELIKENHKLSAQITANLTVVCFVAFINFTLIIQMFLDKFIFPMDNFFQVFFPIVLSLCVLVWIFTYKFALQKQSEEKK